MTYLEKQGISLFELKLLVLQFDCFEMYGKRLKQLKKKRSLVCDSSLFYFNFEGFSMLLIKIVLTISIL